MKPELSPKEFRKNWAWMIFLAAKNVNFQACRGGLSGET